MNAINQIKRYVELAYPAIPLVGVAAFGCGKAIELIEENPKISNIVLGVGLVGSGLYMMASSGVPRLVGSYFKGQNQTEHSHERQVTSWGKACAGLVVTSLGIYTIASTIMHEIRGEVSYPSMPLCEKELVNAENEIFRCPAARDLWNKVKAEGEFSVNCMPAETFKHPAGVAMNHRQIYVSTYKYTEEWLVSEPMHENIVFELNNLKGAAEKMVINDNICSVGYDTYADIMEKVEMNTVRDTVEVLKQCVNDGIWTTSSSLEVPNESQVLSDGELTGHTDAYRVEWFKSCEPGHLKAFTDYLRVFNPLAGKRLPHNIDWYRL